MLVEPAIQRTQLISYHEINPLPKFLFQVHDQGGEDVVRKFRIWSPRATSWESALPRIRRNRAKGQGYEQNPRPNACPKAKSIQPSSLQISDAAAAPATAFMQFVTRTRTRSLT